MLHFTSLGLSAPILNAITDEGYTTPTPIQSQAIPPVLAGNDLLGCAQTGTGKTAAFALPILNRLSTEPVDKTRRGPVFPRALILAPTRELAGQIGDSFATYGRHTHLTHTVIYGGVSQHHQVRALEKGVDILVATPGRLMDLMQQRRVNLSNVRVLVLDEADRMLDMGFIAPIRRIAAALPSPRQTLMFSATMPKEIMRLAESLLKNPVKVAVTPIASTVPLTEQSVYMVPRHRKQALLNHLLGSGKDCIARALVFTRTKRGADKVSQKLNAAGINADAIHGNKAQNQRQRALDGFRTGRSRVLVATDVAARGLDVEGITHVFNFDMPYEAESYVHRIGRTGRAGATGIAISFCDSEERDCLRDIEKLTGKKIGALTTPPSLAEAEPYEPRPYGIPNTPNTPNTNGINPRSSQGAPRRSTTRPSVQRPSTPRPSTPRPSTPRPSVSRHSTPSAPHTHTPGAPQHAAPAHHNRQRQPDRSKLNHWNRPARSQSGGGRPR